MNENGMLPEVSSIFMTELRKGSDFIAEVQRDLAFI